MEESAGAVLILLSDIFSSGRNPLTTQSRMKIHAMLHPLWGLVKIIQF